MRRTHRHTGIECVGRQCPRSRSQARRRQPDPSVIDIALTPIRVFTRPGGSNRFRTCRLSPLDPRGENIGSTTGPVTSYPVGHPHSCREAPKTGSEGLPSLAVVSHGFTATDGRTTATRGGSSPFRNGFGRAREAGNRKGHTRRLRALVILAVDMGFGPRR